MKKQSVEVLNDADAMMRRVNWQLFVAEQEALLYDLKSYVRWTPGMPLYNRFVPVIYVRPIYEVLNDNMVRVLGRGDTNVISRCLECEVWWDGDEPCFICGEEREYLEQHLERGLVMVWSHITQESSDAGWDKWLRSVLLEHELAEQRRVEREQWLNAQSQAEALDVEFSPRFIRGMQAIARVMDEEFSPSLENATDQMWTFAAVMARNSEASRQVSLTDIAARLCELPVRRGGMRWGSRTPDGIRLPRGWQELRRDVPMPEGPFLPVMILPTRLLQDEVQRPGVTDQIVRRLNARLSEGIRS